MSSVKRTRVVFGIDDRFPSRVAASILRNQGFDLLAVHLQIDLGAHGADPTSYPSALSTGDTSGIEKFCESLGVPLKIIDVAEETLAKVFNPFWIATLTGKRFAADAAWAKEILFPHLESIAKARGAESIATGHFAKKASSELYRYQDSEFDQSRTLARLESATIEKLILPTGEVSLDMLLRLAREIGAVPKTEERIERGTRELSDDRAVRGRWEWTRTLLSNPRVRERAAGDYFNPGPTTGSTEFSVAEHDGIPFYQIGTEIGSGKYVLDIIPTTRALAVGNEENLSTLKVIVQDLVWCGPPPKDRHRLRPLTIERAPGSNLRRALGPVSVRGNLLEYPGRLAEILFETPLVGIAPGETLVFYEETRVLGSAIVAEKTIEKPAPAA